MQNSTIIKEILPEDVFGGEVFNKLHSDIINALSENKLSISQTRHLFNSILNQFEREMPVTNHKL